MLDIALRVALVAFLGSWFWAAALILRFNWRVFKTYRTKQPTPLSTLRWPAIAWSTGLIFLALFALLHRLRYPANWGLS